MSKGDAEHAAQHQHGVQSRKEPPTPLTVEQRVAKLEARVHALENQVPVDAPPVIFHEVVPTINTGERMPETDNETSQEETGS